MTGVVVTSDGAAVDLSSIKIGISFGYEEVGLDCTRCPRWSASLDDLVGPMPLTDVLERAVRHMLEAHAPAAAAERPKHGVGSLGHGYVEDECSDRCNNGQCRRDLLHYRCTLECSAQPVWDGTGCPWAPDAPNLRAPLLAFADWTPEAAHAYERERELMYGGDE